MTLHTTFSGIPIHYPNVSENDIRFGDISHALASRTVFNGGATHPITEAQLAVYLSYFIGDTYEAYGLLHNAWKAYVPDVPDDEKVAPSIFEARQRVTNTIRKMADIDDQKHIAFATEQAQRLESIAAKTLLVNPEFIFQKNPKIEGNDGLKGIDRNFHVWSFLEAKVRYNERLFDTTGIMV